MIKGARRPDPWVDSTSQLHQIDRNQKGRKKKEKKREKEETRAKFTSTATTSLPRRLLPPPDPSKFLGFPPQYRRILVLRASPDARNLRNPPNLCKNPAFLASGLVKIESFLGEPAELWRSLVFSAPELFELLLGLICFGSRSQRHRWKNPPFLNPQLLLQLE